MTTIPTTKPCMIALEGTKGSGKSTLMNLVIGQIHLLPLKPVYYRPTSPATMGLPVARWLCLYPKLAQKDYWQEKLYAERAQWYGTQIPQDAECILADRCIATSYATRWQKWGDPNITIRRVDKLHTKVPLPDYIIWLDCPPEVAIKRIAGRAQRNYGLHDQTPQRIKETYEAYQQIRVNPPPRLALTQWISVDATQDMENLASSLMDIIAGCQNTWLQKHIPQPNLLQNI